MSASASGSRTGFVRGERDGHESASFLVASSSSPSLPFSLLFFILSAHIPFLILECAKASNHYQLFISHFIVSVTRAE
jgi:hypothetical protein